MRNNFNQDYAYYQGVLVLPKDFDKALLKKAYRREAMKWHPDKNPDDAYAEERLKLVNEAYEFLNKHIKRDFSKENFKNKQSTNSENVNYQNKKSKETEDSSDIGAFIFYFFIVSAIMGFLL